jgi:transcriptional regulator with XRE-family HTH domain
MANRKTSLRSKIGAHVRKLRQENRWSKTRLANMLGISQNYLSLLERGRGSFTAEQFLIMLEHFNVSVDEFLPSKTPAKAEGQVHDAPAWKNESRRLESELLPADQPRQAADTTHEAMFSAESEWQITEVEKPPADSKEQPDLTNLYPV